MEKIYTVYESGSGKWVLLDTELGRLLYVSSAQQATQLTAKELISLHEFYHDFSIYKRTLHAVKRGSNVHPREAPLVVHEVGELKSQFIEDNYP